MVERNRQEEEKLNNMYDKSVKEQQSVGVEVNEESGNKKRQQEETLTSVDNGQFQFSSTSKDLILSQPNQQISPNLNYEGKYLSYTQTPQPL